MACGGDDDAPSPSDASVGNDAATDGEGGSGGGPMMMMRRDAAVAVPMEDPVPRCDPSAANACGEGQICKLVARFPPSGQGMLYNGCIDDSEPQRGEGDPCDPDITASIPYTAPGLADQVFYDRCGTGLTCAPSKTVRGGGSCQTSCNVGRTGNAQIVQCADPKSACFPATDFADYCRPSDGCDVERQTGCGAGEGCFLWPSDDGKQLLALCSPVVAMPRPDGDAMCGHLSCNAGSVCVGPVHVPISAWSRDVVSCRKVCSESGGVTSTEDAGVDSDAGVGPGGCPSGTECEPFSESEFSFSSIPNPPYGQCE